MGSGLMQKGRYYPTVVSIARGREQLAVFSGNTQNGARTFLAVEAAMKESLTPG